MKLSQCTENCANFHFWYKKWKDNSWKTLKCGMWFMGHIMAVSGLLAEQAVSDHFGGKKPLGDCSCSAISLSLSVTSPLCFASSLPFWPPMFCPSPSSLHLYVFLPFIPFCLSFIVFPQPSPVALYSISLSCAWVLLRVWVYVGLCQCSQSFFLFFFCALEV